MDKIEQRARELLAAEYERTAKPTQARVLRAGFNLHHGDMVAIRVLASALSQQSEARGGVDEVWMFKGTEGDWHTFIDENHRLNTIDDGRWEVRKFAALTGERNG